MNYKLKVEFLEPLIEFSKTLDQKSEEKILYNIWKSRSITDNELIKKLDGQTSGNLKMCTSNKI
jgi:hypothetical protein